MWPHGCSFFHWLTSAEAWVFPRADLWWEQDSCYKRRRAATQRKHNVVAASLRGKMRASASLAGQASEQNHGPIIVSIRDCQLIWSQNPSKLPASSSSRGLTLETSGHTEAKHWQSKPNMFFVKNHTEHYKGSRCIRFLLKYTVSRVPSDLFENQ